MATGRPGSRPDRRPEGPWPARSRRPRPGSASRRCSHRWPSGTCERHVHRLPTVIEARRRPASALREVIAHSNAARRLSSSRSRRSSHAACSSPSRFRSASSASPTAQAEVGIADGGGLARLAQPVAPVLPERLEQPVARPPPSSASRTTSDLSTSAARSSATWRLSMPAEAHTVSAASSVQPPANTDSRSNNAALALARAARSSMRPSPRGSADAAAPSARRP